MLVCAHTQAHLSVHECTPLQAGCQCAPPGVCGLLDCCRGQAWGPGARLSLTGAFSSPTGKEFLPQFRKAQKPLKHVKSKEPVWWWKQVYTSYNQE